MTSKVRHFMHTPRSILRAVGERLRDRRIAAKLTQEQLARRARVSRQRIARTQAGENIGSEPLVRIAMALDAAAEFDGLFPALDTRSLDEVLAAQHKPRRVRYRVTARKLPPA